MDSVQAKAPAKLILSGEHAVVYGAPALAVAIDLYAVTTVEKCDHEGVHFHLPNLDYTKLVTVHTLRSMKNRVKNKLDKFLDGQLQVKEILQAPFELAQFVYINTVDYLKATLSDISISTNSEIPVSCGLGSSAATSLSVIAALSKFLSSDMNADEYAELGQAAEKLQHGYPSGLDIQTILRGGFLSLFDGEINSKKYHIENLYLINTGKPEATTGESVTQVKKQFEKSTIWTEFSDVTRSMNSALEKSDFDLIKQAVVDNQQLLEAIGVVPDAVKKFVSHLSDNQISAKICGSGSVRGNNGGIVWAITDDEEALNAIVNEFGYTLIKAAIDYDGVRNNMEKIV